MRRKKTDVTGFINGLAPLVHDTSKVLILGTMPGEQSLARQEYYGHPRNLFWKLIATVSRQSEPLNYEEKKRLLLSSGIAVWDVCKSCIREGSLDSAIMHETPNELPDFLDKYPEIRTVAFNSRKAEELFDKYFERSEKYNYLSLPSSSPANASIRWEEKMERWKKLNEK